MRMFRKLKLGFDPFSAPKLDTVFLIGQGSMSPAISQGYDMSGSIQHLVTTVFLKIDDRFLHVSHHL